MRNIQLTQNKMCIVDNADYDLLSKYKWNYHQGYPSRNKRVSVNKRITWRIYNELLGKQIGMDIDHINGNTLDNRRCNLRICRHAQNSYNQILPKNNTSGYKGVTWYKRYNKWLAQTLVDGKRKNLGYFNNKLDAAKAYNEAAIKYFGKFARINKI